MSGECDVCGVLGCVESNHRKEHRVSKKQYDAKKFDGLADELAQVVFCLGWRNSPESNAPVNIIHLERRSGMPSL